MKKDLKLMQMRCKYIICMSNIHMKLTSLLVYFNSNVKKFKDGNDISLNEQIQMSLKNLLNINISNLPILLLLQLKQQNSD